MKDVTNYLIIALIASKWDSLSDFWFAIWLFGVFSSPLWKMYVNGNVKNGKQLANNVLLSKN